MELELVIGTIRKDIKSTILMHMQCMTVYLLFVLQAGTYTLKIKFGEIKWIFAFS